MIRQKTVNFTSMMFSSPVSIKLSSGTGRVNAPRLESTRVR